MKIQIIAIGLCFLMTYISAADEYEVIQFEDHFRITEVDHSIHIVTVLGKDGNDIGHSYYLLGEDGSKKILMNDDYSFMFAASKVLPVEYSSNPEVYERIIRYILGLYTDIQNHKNILVTRDYLAAFINYQKRKGVIIENSPIYTKLVTTSAEVNSKEWKLSVLIVNVNGAFEIVEMTGQTVPFLLQRKSVEFITAPGIVESYRRFTRDIRRNRALFEELLSEQ